MWKITIREGAGLEAPAEGGEGGEVVDVGGADGFVGVGDVFDAHFHAQAKGDEAAEGEAGGEVDAEVAAIGGDDEGFGGVVVVGALAGDGGDELAHGVDLGAVECGAGAACGAVGVVAAGVDGPADVVAHVEVESDVDGEVESVIAVAHKDVGDRGGIVVGHGEVVVVMIHEEVKLHAEGDEVGKPCAGARTDASGHARGEGHLRDLREAALIVLGHGGGSDEAMHLKINEAGGAAVVHEGEIGGRGGDCQGRQGAENGGENLFHNFRKGTHFRDNGQMRFNKI